MQGKMISPSDVTKAVTKEIRTVMDKSAGLYLLELPTGTSKSYSTFQAICNYILRSDSKRPILFLTPQKKNLKFDTMRVLYCAAYHRLHPSVSDEDILKDFHRDCCFLNNKFSYLDRLINSELEIPSKVQKESAYTNMIMALRQRSVVPQDKWNFLFRDIELAFKELILNLMYDRFPNVKKPAESRESRNEFLLSHLSVLDGIFPWVRELYPGTFIQSKRVVFMSFDKFLYGNSSIFPYMSDFRDLFVNPIVIIDEVDSTHDSCEKYIINKALDSRGDLIKLFLDIYHGLQEHENWGKDLQKIAGKTVDVLLDNASEIMEKYQLLYDVKYSGKTKASLFSMSSSFYFTVGEKYSYMEFDKEENKTMIHVVSYPEYQKYLDHCSVEERLYPARMLLDIRYFLFRLYQYVYRWAEIYRDMKSLDIHQSISTIYDRVGINQDIFPKNENILCSIPPFQKKKKKEKENPFSIPMEILDNQLNGEYFKTGYSMLDLVNYEYSNERTNLRYFTKNRTAESALIHLADTSIVIGISATATINHYRNYYLPTLQDSLEDYYYPMSQEIQQIIRDYYQGMLDSYRAHHIEINPQRLSMPSFTDFNDVYSFFTDLYDGEANLAHDISRLVYQKALETVEHKDASTSDPWYYVYRYANIAEAMSRFYHSSSAHAWLFLNRPLLKEHNPSFDLAVIQEMKERFDKLILHRNRKTNIHILSSGDDKKTFQDQEEAIKKDLREGVDVLVFSSYASISTGINPDFESRFYAEDYEDIFSQYRGKDSDPRHERRDFDGFVLGEITHILPFTDSADGSADIDDLTRHEILSLILVLVEIDAIKGPEAEKYIYQLLKNDKVVQLRRILQPFLSKCSSYPFIAGYCKYILMQALGRGNRAFSKNHHIQIFCHEKNLRYLSCAVPDSDTSIRTPEWQALMTLIKNPQTEPMEFKGNRAFNSNRRATEATIDLYNLLGFNFNSNMEWTESKQKTYDLLGDFVLRFPTFDDIEQVIQSRKYSPAEADLIRKFSQAYCHFEDKRQDSYRYLEDTRHQPYLFGFSESKEEAIHRYDLEPDRIRRCDTVSFARTSLPFLFDKLPELKGYMWKQGYAVSFTAAHNVLNPLLFINFYLGRIGEIVGSWILSHATHGQLQLHNLDLKHYELFDRQLSSGDPIDFKHWRYSTCFYADKEALIRKMKRKLDCMQEDNLSIQHAYLIRLCDTPVENAFCRFSDSEESYAPYYEDKEHQIIQIPYLVNQDGINFDAIHKILEYEYGRTIGRKGK